MKTNVPSSEHVPVWFQSKKPPYQRFCTVCGVLSDSHPVVPEEAR